MFREISLEVDNSRQLPCPGSLILLPAPLPPLPLALRGQWLLLPTRLVSAKDSITPLIG
jgi:hypothetical protein